MKLNSGVSSHKKFPLNIITGRISIAVFNLLMLAIADMFKESHVVAMCALGSAWIVACLGVYFSDRFSNYTLDRRVSLTLLFALFFGFLLLSLGIWAIKPDAKIEESVWLKRKFRIDKQNGGTIETCDSSNYCIKFVVEPIDESGKEPRITIRLSSTTIPSFQMMRMREQSIRGIVPIKGAWARISFKEFEIHTIVENVDYQSVDFLIRFAKTTFKPKTPDTFFTVTVVDPRLPLPKNIEPLD